VIASHNPPTTKRIETFTGGKSAGREPRSQASVSQEADEPEVEVVG